MSNYLAFLTLALITVTASTAAAAKLELTAKNYDESTAGKTVFIKFYAPWCGHCKAIKPTWDALMKEFEGHPSILIADVDCTAADAQGLCADVGVKGYPTLKHGDPSALEDYSGARELGELQKFAETLKPACSPANIDLCDDVAKAAIEAFRNMPAADLEAKIQQKEKLVKEAEETFSAEVEKLNEIYKNLLDARDKTTKDVKASGLGFMKAVRAAVKQAGKKSEL
jgi:protein disulfide-isomerase-like protein